MLRKIEAGTRMETIAAIGLVYVDDMFALSDCPVARLSGCPIVQLGVCLGTENSQSLADVWDTSKQRYEYVRVHISLSMTVVNMTVIRTTQMLEWRVQSMAKTCLACLELGALHQKRTFIKLATSLDDKIREVEYTFRIY